MSKRKSMFFNQVGGGVYNFATKIELQTAVNLWVSNEASAIATYGQINTWGVSSITDMGFLFAAKPTFNSDISNWDTSNVTTMDSMFLEATTFNQPLDSWDVSSVTIMGDMFESTGAFNQDLNTWDVSNVTDMKDLFQDALAFNGNITSWNTISATNMTDMFKRTNSFNQDIGGWNTSNVLIMENMFQDASAFDQDISLWDVNQVTLLLGFGGQVLSTFTLSTANYDALLIGWDSQGVMSYTGTVDFGSSQYTLGGAAEAARTSLIAKWGGILDGGGI